jgi:hypothetical protein
MTTKPEIVPPLAEINKLVDWILSREDGLGPIRNKDHIVNAAWVVQEWLDINLMTAWSQETIEKH